MTQTKNPTLLDMGANLQTAVTTWASAQIAQIEKQRNRRAVYKRVVEELSQCSDRDLNDIGFARSQIKTIARDAANEL